MNIRIKFICPVSGVLIPVTVLTCYSDNDIPMQLGQADQVVGALNTFDNCVTQSVPVDNLVEAVYQTWEVKKRFGIQYSSTVNADRYSFYGQLPATSCPQIIFVLGFSAPIGAAQTAPIRLCIDYTLGFRNRNLN